MSKFITFEGIEGTGKTINMEFVQNYLKDKGLDAIITREPGGTELGEEVREVLLSHRKEKVSGEVELLLYFAARRHHLENVIFPTLKEGKYVLSDRFTDSSYAYQGAGRGIPKEKIALLETFVQDKFTPDLIFILDVPVDVGLERARGRGSLDRIEVEEKSFFEKARKAYLDRAKTYPNKYVVIDTLNPINVVQEAIAKNLDQKLG